MDCCAAAGVLVRCDSKLVAVLSALSSRSPLVGLDHPRSKAVSTECAAHPKADCLLPCSNIMSAAPTHESRRVRTRRRGVDVPVGCAPAAPFEGLPAPPRCSVGDCCPEPPSCWLGAHLQRGSSTLGLAYLTPAQAVLNGKLSKRRLSATNDLLHEACRRGRTLRPPLPIVVPSTESTSSRLLKNVDAHGGG